MTVEVISPAYDVLDERFLEVRGDERLDSLYDGCRWAEGGMLVGNAKAPRRTRDAVSRSLRELLAGLAP